MRTRESLQNDAPMMEVAFAAILLETVTHMALNP